MRIPWTATLDALLEELNQYLDTPVDLSRKEGWTDQSSKGRGVLEAIEKEEPADNPETHLKLAIEKLLEARQQLEKARFRGFPAPRRAKRPERDLSYYNYTSLDELDANQVRYPDQEGREGLARFVEEGGLFGPVIGQHIASVIRGTAKLKPGLQSTFEEGLQRRFAVKRIATIQHLYDVGRKKAVEMFCSAESLDDPEGTAIERFSKWVERDQKHAQKEISNNDLSERDERHYLRIIHGLHSDLPKGMLKGRPYPEAFNELKRQFKS